MDSLRGIVMFEPLNRRRRLARRRTAALAAILAFAAAGWLFGALSEPTPQAPTAAFSAFTSS